MPVKETKTGKIECRPAQPEDASLASRLIFDTFPKMATYIIGLGDDRRARKILKKFFGTQGHRLSYEFTEMICEDGNVVGMFIAYPGHDLTQLGWRMGKLILQAYRLAGKIKVIQRGLSLIFIQEAAPDEYLLSNLGIKKSARNRGIGAQVLPYIEQKARQAGFHKLALMVDIDNRDAKRFYERHGFAVKAMHLEANSRVKHLGPGYLQMVKTLQR
ncbi:MAG: GNAT family N-acetyltransferase [Brevefilum sp.]|nr:GNAT family N-acetyltransferase [Brevefilum sp.]